MSRSRPDKNQKTAGDPPPAPGAEGTRSPRRGARPVVITPGVLCRRPALRLPTEGGDKEERGCVLVVGGAPEMPGAVILAATAALRAGAGKLQIATVRSIAPLVAAQVPEVKQPWEGRFGSCIYWYAFPMRSHPAGWEGEK